MRNQYAGLTAALMPRDPNMGVGPNIPRPRPQNAPGQALPPQAHIMGGSPMPGNMPGNMPGMPLMENPGMGPKYAQGPSAMSMGTSPMQQMPQQMMPFMGGRGVR